MKKKKKSRSILVNNVNALDGEKVKRVDWKEYTIVWKGFSFGLFFGSSLINELNVNKLHQN